MLKDNTLFNYKRLQTYINIFEPIKVIRLSHLCPRDRNKSEPSESDCLIKIYIVMSLRNKVTLIGYTGKEVEIVNFENGGIKASVSLATNDHYTNAKGEKVEETQWHNLVAFGKVAEIIQKYVPKGKEIAIEGKLTYRTYEDKEGNKRSITEIRVDELLLLGAK